MLARVQLDVIKTLLENAEHDDTFTLLAATSQIRALADKPLAVQPKNVERAAEFLEKTQLVGALDLEKAFTAAAEVAGTVEQPCLVHLGSGYPKLGQNDPEALVRLLPKETAYVGVAVGNRWNRALMKRLAGNSGGYVAQINPNEPVTWRAIELASRLNAPRLTNVRVVDDRERLQFLNMSDVVCQGEELFSVVRLDVGNELPKFVEVTGLVDGKPYSKRLPVKDIAKEADYLPRTWSKLEIDRLVAEDALAHHDEIVNLSMAMYVMSPFTSLLVLENEEMYNEYHVDRGRKDHWAMYPCPETIEVVHEPLRSESECREEIREGRPGVDDVLKTIVVRGRRGTPYTVWQVSRPGYPRNRSLYRWGYSAETERPFQVRGRVVAGTSDAVPMLGTLPYVNRLFGAPAIGRETQSLMMMVTPRIIIQEEEEERLGILWDESDVSWSRNSLDVDWDGSVTLGMSYPVASSADSRMRVWTSEGDAFTLDQGLPLYGSQGIEMADSYSLIDLTMATVQPESWDTMSGPSTDFMQPSLDMALSTKVYPVADLIMPVQEIGGEGIPGLGPSMLSESYSSSSGGLSLNGQIKRQLDLVDALYNTGLSHIPFPDEPLIYPPAEVWAELTARRDDRYRLMDPSGSILAKKDVRVALDEKTTADFADQPLSDVVEFWGNYHHIDIRLATGYLQEAGISPRAKVTIRLSGVSLRSALRLILGQVNLTYVVTDDCLLILPPQYAERFVSFNRSLHFRSPKVDDLLVYAPAMHTTMADVLAVLDAEAGIADKPRTGRIDPRARQLIDRSRRGGWQRLTAKQNEGLKTDVAFDGQGRFRVDFETSLGLKETVLSDGEHLWHLYPELGVGAQRLNSRFYQNLPQARVPWLLPAADQLARGADVAVVDDRTVAVVPHPSDESNQDEAKPTVRIELRLVFAGDGRLAERQLVRSDSHQVLLRETYDSSGTLRLLDADGKECLNRTIVTEPCEAPDLRPDPSLVVLPLPWRTREHVLAARGLTDDGAHKNWSTEDALAVLAAETAAGNEKILSTIGWCFLAKGDRRPGFYTLLLAAGVKWDAKPDDDPYGVRHLFVPLQSTPDELITHYVTALQESQLGKEKVGPLGGSADAFPSRLAQLHDLWLDWQQLVGQKLSADQLAELERQTAQFVNQAPSAAFAVSALAAVAQYGGKEPLARIGDKVAPSLRQFGPAAFPLRLLHAESVAETEKTGRGRDLFRALIDDMLDARIVPRLSPETKATFFPGNEEPDAWQAIVDRITNESVAHLVGPQALSVAFSLHQLGAKDHAERIFASVTASTAAQGPGPETLAAVSYLWQIGQRPRAEAMLGALLETDPFKDAPTLWRFAGLMAEEQGRPARAAECLDRALALQFDRLPEEVNLNLIRTDYGRLLGLFDQAAQSGPSSDPDFQAGRISRIVASADRWRSLDPQPAEPCRLAGAALARLGAVDLAWDYVTSPLATADQPPINWSDLASNFHQQGQYELADRAYGLAFKADPTNAEILWNRARARIESGRGSEARDLLQTLASGSWNSKYGAVQQQAKRALASVTDTPGGPPPK